MKTLSEIEKAWLAGVIDGEGSIAFYPDSRGHGAQIRVQVANTNQAFLCKVRAVVEDGIVRGRKGKRPAHWSVPFEWVLTGHGRCRDLLRQLLPYLIIKQEVAKRVILFVEYRYAKGAGKPRVRRYGVVERTMLEGRPSEIDEIRRLL